MYIDRPTAIDAVRNFKAPLWRPISSRQLAALLGVSLQSLANWRVRGYGPPYLPHITGTGNKIYYRPDEVLAWLSGGTVEPWEFVRDWLAERDLQGTPATQESTKWLAESTDAMFPK